MHHAGRPQPAFHLQQRNGELRRPTFEAAFGGPNADRGIAVTTTVDGGYAVTGTTTSFGAGAEDVYLNQLMLSEDAKEGLQAVMEKRKPVWKNK